MLTRSSFRLARAFSLIEVLVVVIVLGMLSVFALNHLQPVPATRALALYSAAQKLFNGWTVVADACGVGKTTDTSQVPASGYGVLDVLANGKVDVSSTYQRCYSMTQLKPLDTTIRPAPNGAKAVESFPVSVAGGGFTPFVVTYDEVTPDVAQVLVQRFSESPPNALQTSNSSDARVRYQLLADGNYQMHLLFSGNSVLAAASPLPGGPPTTTPPTSVVTPGGQGASPGVSPVTLPPTSPSPTPPGGQTTPLIPQTSNTPSTGCGATIGNGNGNGNGNVGSSNIGNGNGNGNSGSGNGNCNGNNNLNSTNVGNNNGNLNTGNNNGSGNGNTLVNATNTGNNVGNGTGAGTPALPAGATNPPPASLLTQFLQFLGV